MDTQKKYLLRASPPRITYPSVLDSFRWCCFCRSIIVEFLPVLALLIILLLFHKPRLNHVALCIETIVTVSTPCRGLYAVLSDIKRCDVRWVFSTTKRFPDRSKPSFPPSFPWTVSPNVASCLRTQPRRPSCTRPVVKQLGRIGFPTLPLIP